LALERLEKESPKQYQQLLKQPALLAYVLALAAWSPLLSTTLEQTRILPMALTRMDHQVSERFDSI
jgi:hypothetical protein